MTENGMYYHEKNVIPDLPYYHPDRTNLALDWTYHGRWCDIPRNRNHTGPAARGWRIARIEKYLDEEGRIKEAFAYGDDEKNILVWYDLEEFKRRFSNWIEPNPDKPPYENTRRFFKGLRIEKNREEENQVSSSNYEQNQAPRGAWGGFPRGPRARGRAFRGSGDGYGRGGNSQKEEF